MSRIYIKYNKPGTDLVEYYELSVTTNISNEVNSKVTTYTVEGGRNLADHVVKDNERVSLIGIMSDVTTVRLSGNPESNYANSVAKSKYDYTSGIKKIQKRGDPVSIVFGPSGESLDNCIITNLSLTRDATTGKAYRVELSAEQIRVSQRSEITNTFDINTPDDQLESNRFTDKSTVKETSTSEVELTPPQSVTPSYVEVNEKYNILYTNYIGTYGDSEEAQVAADAYARDILGEFQMSVLDGFTDSDTDALDLDVNVFYDDLYGDDFTSVTEYFN
jgi:hypothetical protein